MPDGDRQFEIVREHLRAMQRGPEAEDELVAHFAEDAIYIESLTAGRRQVHRGRAEIRRILRSGLRWNPVDFAIQLNRLELEQDEVVAYWTCTSAQLPAPMRGVDRYQIVDGTIKRLETRLLAT